MTYQEALEWIHSKLTFGIKPGLERMAWMLSELGNPQENLKAVHVVGTNGKGSTTSYLQHIFSQSGYEVGTFTSPYIVDFRERISLNGQMITESDFVALVERVQPVVERLHHETDLEPATEFEVITVLMFEYFGHMHPVDIAIVEAGMGGLYDSTNQFKALAVVCPSIGLDHQAVLGQTYGQIAEQKVGVLKEAVPFIYANNQADVEAVFQAKAQETKSPTYKLGRDFSTILHGDTFDYQGQFGEIEDIHLRMPGQHQVSNASLAITISLLLAQQFPKVTPATIKAGLEATAWAGRTELLVNNLMIDGAHNNESIDALVEVMKAYADKKVHVLFAAINTKPADAMLKRLEAVGQVSVTTFEDYRALALEDYPKGYVRVENWQDWLEQMNLDSEDDFYLITGSLYFISQVRKAFLKR